MSLGIGLLRSKSPVLQRISKIRSRSWLRRQLGAATAKDPSLVASLVCRLSGPESDRGRRNRRGAGATTTGLIHCRLFGNSLRGIAEHTGHCWRCDRGHCDINQGALCGASHVSEIDGTPRSVIHRPWDRVDAGIGTGHKTPCFGYADALVGCFVGSTFASWSEA